MFLVQNPRLRDPLPYERQYFSTLHKSYNKRTAQACDVYDVNRLARKKVPPILATFYYRCSMTTDSMFSYAPFSAMVVALQEDFSWYEPDMTIASSFRRKRGTKAKDLSIKAHSKKEARRIMPPSYGHRPGVSDRHTALCV